MQKIPYKYVVEDSMYAQVCTRSDIMYIVRMLGNNPKVDYWRATKQVLRHLQRTKDYTLTYERLDNPETVGYFDFDFS